jgi:hypothetical protein
MPDSTRRAPLDGTPPDSAVAPANRLAAVSELAATSFASLDEAIDATLSLMSRLLDMEVRMVNQILADRHRFQRMQAPGEFPNVEGMSTPLNHNF